METTLNGLKYSNSEDDNVSTVSNPRAPQDGPSCRQQEALYLRKIELQRCYFWTILCKKGDTE